MPVLPAPSGYSCVRTYGNFTLDVDGSKTIPSGSYIYIPTAKLARFVSSGAGAEITVEPSYSVYTNFGKGDGKWDGA